MKITRNDLLFTISLLAAIWFMLTGIIWIYYAALVIAYPVGILSLIIWNVIKSENKKRTKLIPILLSIGLFLSLGMLTYLLIYE